MTITTHRRGFMLGTAAAAASAVAMPTVLRAQALSVRWGELLAPSHPQVQMIERIAKAVKEKTWAASTSRSSPTASSAAART